MFNLKRALAPALTAVLFGAALVPAGGPATAASVVAPAKRSADEFQMATFNVQGASHRSTRSTRPRTRGAVNYLEKHRVSVVGLQEFEQSQYDAFQRETNGRWGVVGAPTRNGKSVDTRNAVAFLKSRFELVNASYMGIPYFRGKRVNIPVVTLRSRTNGAKFTIINTHNPADTKGRAQRHRNKATRKQVKKVNQLRARGATVFVTGDMNEKKRYFCKMTRSGQMKSASGGSTSRRCQPPKANGIDWVFGSRNVGFSNWTSDKTTRSSGVSDHPIVVARVTLPH